jgi:hypothetical protein
VSPARDDDALAILTPLRAVPRGVSVVREDSRRSDPAADEPAMWFVTVTLAGSPVQPGVIRTALERLAHERPFMVSARYRADRAELRYWDQSDDVDVAIAQAQRMWGDHLQSACLPPWRLIGLEVVDRETARRRWSQEEQPSVLVLGEVRELDPED